MNNNDITFCYVVGGEARHFHNLAKNIRSLERLSYCKTSRLVKRVHILITQFGDCPIPNFYESLPKNFNRLHVIEKDSVTNLGRFMDHIIWKEKYAVALQADTRYVCYLDTDTVLINDNFLQYIPTSPITATQHFWVPTFNQFFHGVNPKDPVRFVKCCEAIGVKENFKIAAGGVFILDREHKICDEVLKETLRLHDLVYPDTHCDYVHGFTDEIIFSQVLSRIPNFPFVNGSLNHCFMREMPLITKDGFLFGKNPFDQDYEIVAFGHCDTFRRDPSEVYKKTLMYNQVCEAFYLERA